MQNWDGLGTFNNEDGSVSFVTQGGKVVMTMSRESFVLQSGLMPNPSPLKLAKKAALLATIAASCACTREPPINIDVRGQPAWVVETLDKAAGFWALQDIEVNVGAFDDGVKVEIVAPDDIGSDLARWAPSSSTIKLSEKLGDIVDPRNADLPMCAVAHEIGHAMGLKHVEEKQSLMAEKATQPPEGGGCWWSVDDQIELCRATGCISEE